MGDWAKEESRITPWFWTWANYKDGDAIIGIRRQCRRNRIWQEGQECQFRHSLSLSNLSRGYHSFLYDLWCSCWCPQLPLPTPAESFSDVHPSGCLCFGASSHTLSSAQHIGYVSCFSHMRMALLNPRQQGVSSVLFLSRWRACAESSTLASSKRLWRQSPWIMGLFCGWR